MVELVDASASKADDLNGRGSSTLPIGSMPEWWNWQTRTTQDRMPNKHGGSSPPSGTNFLTKTVCPDKIDEYVFQISYFLYHLGRSTAGCFYSAQSCSVAD